MSLKTLIARGFTAFSGLSRAVGASGGAAAVRPLSQSVYAATVTGLDGDSVDLQRFAGQVTLVVNVASECGFTPQYRGLQSLHAELAPQGFAVLAFPSNEFGSQEPGSNADIRRFCDERYRVTFPVFARTETKPGPGQSPVYALLAETGHLPAWNFSKYVVDSNGQAVAFFPSQVAPDDRDLRAAIARALR
jgi:glutathione peroxidase